jgi:hypothetical protein
MHSSAVRLAAERRPELHQRALGAVGVSFPRSSRSKGLLPAASTTGKADAGTHPAIRQRLEETDQITSNNRGGGGLGLQGL